MRRGMRTEQMREWECRTSALLLGARSVTELCQPDQAEQLFGEAAQREEFLAQKYSAQGIAEQVMRHLFSAAGCWAQAGNIPCALEIYDDLVGALETPEHLRECAAICAQTVRQKRQCRTP